MDQSFFLNAKSYAPARTRRAAKANDFTAFPTLEFRTQSSKEHAAGKCKHGPSAR